MIDESELLSETKRKMLQEDLAQAMLSAAQVSMKSCADKLCEKSVAKQPEEHHSDKCSESEDVEENSAGQSESSEDEVNVDGPKIQKKNHCYANGCCQISSECTEKVL